ncbi:MAG: hypothetical protein RIB67_01380 [Miltoncostaeaceae bacterium]
MLIPAPPPTYCLSPSLRPLRDHEVRVLEEGIEGLTGVTATALVVAVGYAMGRLVFELSTLDGPVLLMSAGEPERAAA